MAERPRASSESPQSRRGGALPLWHRLYFQRHLTELVRAVGYEQVPAPAMRERLEPLTARYGRHAMRAAMEELLDLDATAEPALYRLSDQTRRLAIQILGRPPEAASAPFDGADTAPPAAGDAPDVTDDAPSLPAVRSPRRDVLPRFVQWLEAGRLAYTAWDHARRREASEGKLGTLDFTVGRDGLPYLVTVRPRLTPLQRTDMLAWPERLGEGVPVRVWPQRSPDAWRWVWHDVAVDGSPHA